MKLSDLKPGMIVKHKLSGEHVIAVRVTKEPFVDEDIPTVFIECRRFMAVPDRIRWDSAAYGYVAQHGEYETILFVPEELEVIK